LEVRVLGPLEVVADDGAVVPLGARQRRLLAALLVGAGEVCSPDWLIEAVWGRSPPASARKVLQVYVSRLRRALPDGMRIRTEESGYALEVDRERLDAAMFERMLDEARASAIEGNAALAVSLLDRADSLWRGNAFGELAYEDFARGEADRLEELRRVCVEERLEAELRLGRHAELLPELQGLAAAHPLRERLQGQAMLALYRCGRQAEALELYAATRARLDEQLGLEPGPELRALQRRILQHDPELAAAADAATASALPAAPNRLLGRERELADLGDLLLRDDVRLLVLTGAGGSGKTRLALEAAREAASSFANGAVFVRLAPLRDPALVPGTVAQAVGVNEVPGEEPLETLARALQARELLLVLDNAEHLRPAVPFFVELLARAPRLTLLVTSRVVLHLSGEHVYPVDPLNEEAARALFLERAHEAEPGFRADEAGDEAIRRICARLDGLPLAIELAASRVRTLTPQELLARLEPRLPLLTGGPRDLPARQQTLRATLEWSYELLEEDERRDLRALSVFAGGCSLDAAEAVCGTTLERLSALVDHNLVRHTTTAQGSRYLMLETVREYASERLQEAGEAEEVHRRHADFFLALAERAAPELEGPEQRRWLDLLEVDHANLREALAWLLRAQRWNDALSATVALDLFWRKRSYIGEAHRWFADVLPHSAGAPLRLQAKARNAAAYHAMEEGAIDEAINHQQRSVRLYRRLRDRDGLSWALSRLARFLAFPGGDAVAARSAAEEALLAAPQHGDQLALRATLLNLGETMRDLGDLENARRYLRKSLEISTAAGDRFLVFATTHSLADLALRERDAPTATKLYLDALRMGAELNDDRNAGHCLAGLAAAAALQHQKIRASKLWGAALGRERHVGMQMLSFEREQYTPLLRDLDPAAVDQGQAWDLADALTYATDDSLDVGDPDVESGEAASGALADQDISR
jgi:predicted ATPase/DNA-binding SARP family transcriptional activator